MKMQITVALITSLIGSAAYSAENSDYCSIANLDRTIKYLERREIAAKKGLETWSNNRELKRDIGELQKVREKVRKWRAPAAFAAGLGASIVTAAPLGLLAGAGYVIMQISEGDDNTPEKQRLNPLNVFASYDQIHQNLHSYFQAKQSHSGKSMSAFIDELTGGINTKSTFEAALYEAETHRTFFEEELAFIKTFKDQIRSARRAGRCATLPQGISISMKKDVPIITVLPDVYLSGKPAEAQGGKQ